MIIEKYITIDTMVKHKSVNNGDTIDLTNVKVCCNNNHKLNKEIAAIKYRKTQP